jgi:hypothetical protein
MHSVLLLIELIKLLLEMKINSSKLSHVHFYLILFYDFTLAIFFIYSETLILCSGMLHFF